MSLPRRQRLHAHVGEAIERVYTSNIDPHVSALAHHLYQAGAAVDQEKVLHFLSEAAAQANRAVAYEEALDHLGKAISLLEGDQTGRTAGLLARRAETLVTLSRHPEAIVEYERALTLLESLDDHVRYAEICIRLHILRTQVAVWNLMKFFQEFESLVDVAQCPGNVGPHRQHCGGLGAFGGTPPRRNRADGRRALRYCTTHRPLLVCRHARGA